MRSHSMPLVLTALIVVFAGCLGGGGSSSGSGGGANWCSAGSTTQFSNPQTGEQVAFEIEGVVEEDGRTVCKGSWTTNQGDIRKMELYWTEDESYQKMILYDGSGEVVNEFVISDGQPGGSS